MEEAGHRVQANQGEATHRETSTSPKVLAPGLVQLDCSNCSEPLALRGSFGAPSRTGARTSRMLLYSMWHCDHCHSFFALCES